MDTHNLSVPVPQFVGGVSDYFPRPGKERSLETGLEKRYEYIVRPTNASNEGFTGDGFIEFRIMGVPGQFIDLSQLVLEVEGYLVKRNGTKVVENDNIQLTNLASCTLIKSIGVFFNNVQVETGINYSYNSYIKTLLNTPAWKEDRSLSLAGYHGLGDMEKVLTVDGLTASKHRNVTDFAFYTPLVLDISTCDGYLIDNVDVRIRIELSNERFVINGVCDAATSPVYRLTKTDLHITKLKPMNNALESLNKKLSTTPMTYMFDKTLYCTTPIASGQSVVTVENPWIKCLPSKIWFILTAMKNTLGVYDSNSIYFDTENIKSIEILIDNEIAYSTSFDWDKGKVQQGYYELLRAGGNGHQALISVPHFKKGSTVHLLALSPEVLEGESMSLEREGYLRINIEFSTPPAGNLMLQLFGETQGVLTIDKDRTVLLDVRQ